MSDTHINAGLIGSGGNSYLGIGKNRVLNGEMLIDQRNVGGAIVPVTGTPRYAVDRMSVFNNGTGVFSVGQQSATPPAGFQKYLHFACTTTDATGGEYRLDHYVEGYNVRDFMLGTATAVTFTLSFWVRSNQTGIWGGCFYNNPGSRMYPYSYTVNNANTWEYKTVSVQGDVTGTWATDTNIGLGIRFGLGLGSSLLTTPGSWLATPPYKYGPTGMNNFMSSTSNTFDITGIQLEVGSSATPFEYLPIDILISRLQRYYETRTTYETQKIISHYSSLNLCYQDMAYKVSKRTVPTVTLSNLYFQIDHTVTSGNGTQVESANWTASAAANDTEGFRYSPRRNSDQTTFPILDYFMTYKADADF